MASWLEDSYSLLLEKNHVWQGFDRRISDQNRNSTLYFGSKNGLMDVRTASGLLGMLTQHATGTAWRGTTPGVLLVVLPTFAAHTARRG